MIASPIHALISLVLSSFGSYQSALALSTHARPRPDPRRPDPRHHRLHGRTIGLLGDGRPAAAPRPPRCAEVPTWYTKQMPASRPTDRRSAEALLDGAVDLTIAEPEAAQESDRDPRRGSNHEVDAGYGASVFRGRMAAAPYTASPSTGSPSIRGCTTAAWSSTSACTTTPATT